jgi:thiosulfate reductase/polysulfide reductase chain A
MRRYESLEKRGRGVARVRLDITRRSFLKGGITAGGLALIDPIAAFSSMAPAINEPWYRTGKIETTYNVCDMCPWRCGVVVSTVDGIVRKIEGNRLDPKSRGMLCARGQGGPSFMYDPDRLQAPMIRTGERGSGSFKEVSWEEALDYVAAGLEIVRSEYGEEALAVFGHTGGDYWFADHFAQAWGTPNAAKPSASLCLSPRDEAATLTYGSAVGGHEPVDWDAVEAMTLIGSHIGEDARNTTMQDFANARARGAKVIVVDPRFSSVAAKADYWLPIKPGTDTALLLAWMNVLISEDLYDKTYVAKWTQGFEELAAHVAELTPDWAAGITDLPAAQIRETAEVMAANLPRAVVVPGRHTTWYGNDTQRMRATYLVNALLGAYGREGGIYFNKSVYLDHYPLPPWTITGSSGGCSAEPGEESDVLPEGPTGKVRADGVRERFLRGPTALQELIEPMITGDPYPIKALMVYGTNLLNSVPSRDRTIEALRALDLVVAIDVLPQEHVAWADVVLPEATYLERYDDLWAVAHKTPYIAMREPAVEPLYDTKPGWWISRQLGLRLGLDDFYKWETIEEFVDKRLVSVGSSLEKMRSEGGIITQNGKPYLEDYGDASPFPTASGLINLYSEELADAGFDPMPVYEPVDEPPPGFFRLLYGRSPVHTFAKTQNTPVLSDVDPENEVWINEDAAEELEINDGQYVMLENQDGKRSGPVKVKATQRIRRDAVFIVHGFGHDSPGLTRANGKGASDTELQSRYRIDPISGGAGMRVNFVRLDKAGV